jgi:Tol biopolymer transport system component
LVEGVLRTIGAPQYAVSDSGTLVYVPGTTVTSPIAQRMLLWVDRNGREEPIAAAPNFYKDPKISPDGTKIALAAFAGSYDIWIWDIVRQAMTRLTFDGASDFPLWTPDGKRIAYLSRRERSFGVYWKAADGTGKDEILRSGEYLPVPASWSDGGKTLIIQDITAEVIAARSAGIGALSTEGDRKWKPLLKENVAAQPRISPDGQWMAYDSFELGRFEVYVRPFPDVDRGRWQVSTSGGDSPLWSRDGRELFYRSGDAVMAVSVKADAGFSPGTPKPLFRGAYVSFDLHVGRPDLNPWDISPDGKRFLMMKEAAPTGKPAAAESPRKINIVMNWLEELKQRVPRK